MSDTGLTVPFPPQAWLSILSPKSSQRGTATYRSMLQAIRFNPVNSIDLLREQLGVSWPTAKSFITFLLGKKTDNPNIDICDVPLIAPLKSGGFSILPTPGLFLGISIGSKNIRSVLVDYAFHPLTVEERCALDLGYPWNEADKGEDAITRDTPEPLSQLRECCERIIQPLLKRCGQGNCPPLLGIGLALPGPIDYEKGRVVKSMSRVELENVGLTNLLGTSLLRECMERGIFLSLDNNAKASAVSEYEYLLTQPSAGPRPRDMAVIYVGTGLGAGMVVQGRLLRGARNLSGEIGHISPDMSDEQPECRCGRRGCIEARLEDEKRGGIASGAEDTHSKGPKLKDERDVLRKYLSVVLNMISGVVSSDIVIFTGHDVRKTENLVELLNDDKSEFLQPYVAESTQLRYGRRSSATAAIGAAIEAYYSMCGCDYGRLVSLCAEPREEPMDSQQFLELGEQFFVNNAFEIEWIR